jgi:ABC-type antimicrobial peptide transport system permease subunit
MPLAELTAMLAADLPVNNGLQLPEGTEKLGVWAYPIDPRPGLIIIAKIRDGRGHYADYELGSPLVQDWQFLEVDLEDPAFGRPPEPLTLQTIYARVKRTGFFSGGNPTAIHFDDLQVAGTMPSGQVIVDDFEEAPNWITVAEEAAAGFAAGMPSTQDTVVSSQEIVYEGESSLKFNWVPRRNFGLRGIYPNLDTSPMALIVSQSLLNRTGISVGDSVTIRVPGQFIPAVIEAAVNYFPTLDPDVKGFALANIDRLTSIRNLAIGGKVGFYPNEIWLDVTHDPDAREAAVETLTSPRYRAREFYDQEAMIAKSKADPLVAAGWGGILLIAFLGVILVSGLGFVVYAYLSARGRQLEFAILRTVGFSLRQIIGLICLEQIFVIGSGMGIGTLLGMRLSGVMMPFLQLTERGQRVLPPFVPVIDWLTIGIAYMILAVAFIITVSLVVLYFSRTAIHRALRIGEV